LFPGDASFYVLEGSVAIDLVATGERVELKEGDIASFPKWHPVGLDVQRAVQEVHRHLELTSSPLPLWACRVTLPGAHLWERRLAITLI